MSAPEPPLTDLLREWSLGAPELADEVIPHLYRELKQIAAREFRRERRDHTLQATGLVHEVYLKLREVQGVHWASREQFLGFAAHLTRRILVEHARRHNAAKRGAGLRVTLTESAELGGTRAPDLVALDDALRTLASVDARKAAVVEMRFFGGLNQEETARLLQVSVETVGREWRRARAWLFQQLYQGQEVPDGP